MSKRSTNAVVAERVKALKGMILAGSSNSVCVRFASDEWGISTRTAYRLLRSAWCSIHDDVDQVGTDRKQLLALSIHWLQAAAAQGLEKGNSGAAVAAVRELNLLCGLGSHNSSLHRR